MTRVARFAAAMLLVLVTPFHATAEMRRVRLSVLGMDCAICAHSLVVVVRKVEGVESVDVSLERAAMDVRLRAANRITLGQLRQLVKNTGFIATDAVVTAVGTLVDHSGKPGLDVVGTNAVWLLVADQGPVPVFPKEGGQSPFPKSVEPFREATRRLSSKQPGLVEVTGVVRAPTSASQQEQILVTAVGPVAK
jgi:copper chaperone CopZ